MHAKRLRNTIAFAGMLLVLAACASAPSAAPAEPAAPAAPAATAASAAASQPTVASATEAPAAEAPAAPVQPEATTPDRTPAEPTSVSAGGQPALPAANATVVPTIVATATAVPDGALQVATPVIALPTAAEPTPTPASAPAPIPASPTPLPAPTAEPSPAATPTAIVQGVTQEARIVELEWPPQMRLGESDLVRLALIPSAEGYTVTTEFQGNQAVTKTVSVERPTGYDLNLIGRLDGVGFAIAPEAEQRSSLPAGVPVTLRWTISPQQSGQQRLSVLLKLLWTPTAGSPASATPREAHIYSRGLDVQVGSIMGMTPAQASAIGLMGLALGGGLSALALAIGRGRRAVAAEAITAAKPNAALAIEPLPGIHISEDEQQLLRTLFRKYSRLSIERDFRSGYSGARTLLCLPIRSDGRADAYTIAKMGERRAIQHEFENYETFVKDTLPPVTARIQEPPVTLTPIGISSQAVLRYTFIGEQGKMPVSLRESLLTDPNPALVRKLFETFGPNWWLQRSPYSFRLSQEYDRLLPAHLVVEPFEENTRAALTLKGDTPPAGLEVGLGDVVMLRDFSTIEQRPDGASYSLTGQSAPGQPPLRIRLLSPIEPRKPGTYRVTGNRETLLRGYVAGLDLLGLPDPLLKLAETEHRSISGTQSPIHGDLNLENVLVGPGGFVWLIDFAHTREGHPLYDFAHLEAEIITQVIAPQMSAPDYLTMLQALDAHTPAADGHTPQALIAAVREVAWRCLFNAMQKREYWLALYMACLGALKFTNLNAHQRHLLYLTAAHVAQKF